MSSASFGVAYDLCVAVIENIELTKKIVTLSGLRWKIVPKATACESVANRDVFKRFGLL